MGQVRNLSYENKKSVGGREYPKISNIRYTQVYFSRSSKNISEWQLRENKQQCELWMVLYVQKNLLIRSWCSIYGVNIKIMNTTTWTFFIHCKNGLSLFKLYLQSIWYTTPFELLLALFRLYLTSRIGICTSLKKIGYLQKHSTQTKLEKKHSFYTQIYKVLSWEHSERFYFFNGWELAGIEGTEMLNDIC